MVEDWLAESPEACFIEHQLGYAGERALWPQWLPAAVRSAIQKSGIRAPWLHQADAADAIFSGQHTVLATGTASGKTLCYAMPILAATINDADAVLGFNIDDAPSRLFQPKRRHTALYLAPTKALAHDQLRAVSELAPPQWCATTLDGDSDESERRYALEVAAYLLTNPDMLHYSILPHHAKWAPILRSLRYVVVDEAHRYRGVFGAHVSAVLRRLRRICAHYGANPVFIGASATATRAAETMHLLTGISSDHFKVVEEDFSCRGDRDVVLWRPSIGVHQDAARILAELVNRDQQTLAFVGSRVWAELVATKAQQLVQHGKIAAYRSGFLAHDRRRLEQQLQSGELTGVAATNALELGVDVSGMDAVVIAGFPGTLSAFWQQAGRAGRGAEDALTVLVAKPDPLDHYLFDHPELIFSHPVEPTLLYPNNRRILGPHLCAAAQEIPLTSDDSQWFGSMMPAVVQWLTERSFLRERPTGWFWTRAERAVAGIDIRSMGGKPIDVIDQATGRVIGHVDRSAADRVLHPGAVYLHQGEQWLVTSCNESESQALVRWDRPGYYTQPLSSTQVAIIDVNDEAVLGQGTVCRGMIELRTQLRGFLRRDELTGEVWDETPLEMAERVFETQAMWWLAPVDLTNSAGLRGSALGAAAHAAEHTAIGLLPVFAPCDRWDIGGVSMAQHPQTGQCSVFIHDGLPGGAGFAFAGFDHAHQWLSATLQRLIQCDCLTGCPRCCVSPKCGNANQRLDKAGAIELLKLFISADFAAER